MLMLAFTVVFLVFFLAIKFFIRSISERLFLFVFSLSTVYYGILGPWYWMEYKESYFLGEYWGEQMPIVVWSFVMVHFLVAVTFSFLVYRRRPIIFIRHKTIVRRSDKVIPILLLLGFCSAAYSYIIGSELSGNGALIDDPFLLIFYQFSDIPIGVLLFAIAKDGFYKKWCLLSLLYLMFTIVVGLRYKTALLIGPLILFLYFRPSNNKLLKRMFLLFCGVLIVIFFSIMTITRVKFSGLDMNALKDANADEILYGFFAETNLIFGLASSYNIFGESVPFAGITPFLDVIVQFVPRFIYPTKHLYQHLEELAWSISYSSEAQKSGTSIPFFGEYYAAFGWIGMIVGVILYTIFSQYLLKFVLRYSYTNNQILMGASLIIVFTAYYYFSRGSIAQIFKGLVFACGPFLYLLRAQRLSYVKLTSRNYR